MKTAEAKFQKTNRFVKLKTMAAQVIELLPLTHHVYDVSQDTAFENVSVAIFPAPK